MSNTKLQQAVAAIDQVNAEDPNSLTLNGETQPLEVAHAERRTYWIQQIVGEDASEALLLATRAQHIRRWEIPRSSYPRERVGYLRWRTDLKKFHAEQTAAILETVGYDAATIGRVADLMQKKHLKQDPETQALEDALCLVFLETQFSEFARKEADKIVEIVRKTWVKMSKKGRELALTLPMTDEDQAIILQALQDEP